MGCAPELVEALAADGIVRPMEAQALAWDTLRRQPDRDVALVAEAGSGKTLSYLAPLVDSLLSEPAATAAGGCAVHVIVPTADLVAQVLRVARSLCALAPAIRIGTVEDAAAASSRASLL